MASTEDPFVATTQARIRELREETTRLERTLNFYLGEGENLESHAPAPATADVAEANPRRQQKHRVVKTAPTRSSKYVPMIAAWESLPDKGFSVEELHALAKKTVAEVPNANSLRTFLFTMKNEGRVRKSDDGKWHIIRV